MPEPQNFVVEIRTTSGFDRFPCPLPLFGLLTAGGRENASNNILQRTPRTLFVGHHSLSLLRIAGHARSNAYVCAPTLTGDAELGDSDAGLGCEPLGDTRELFRPGGLLHSFEHAGKRALGGCRGVRGYATRYACTPLTHTQLTGTQLTLTQRNGTRYATDATLTQLVPEHGTDFC